MRMTIITLILAATPALAEAPDVQFRAAQQKEIVEGDLASAIKLYRQVADKKATPPALAARALLRLGGCYERLGSTEAAKAYERVVSQFSKEEAAAEARKRLASLSEARSNAPEAELVARKVVGDLPWVSNTLTRDGRYTLTKPGLGLELLDLVTGTRKPVRGGLPLVSAGEFSRDPVIISPDGRRFAFPVSAPGRGELRIADVDGSGIRTLSSLPDKLWSVPLDWSTDGHTILALPIAPTAGHNELLLIDADGKGVRPVRVTPPVGGRARLSPDGQWIAFEGSSAPLNVRYDRRGDVLFLIRTDGSGERPLVKQGGTATLVGWAPDGRSVLFVSEHLGVDHLWAMPMKEGGDSPSPVSVMKGFSHSTVLGITSQGVVFYSAGSWGTQSFTARLNGPGGTLSSPRGVKAQANRLALSPVWSPDGRYLAYEYNEPDRMDGAIPPAILIVRDVANGQEREVSRFPRIGRRMSWTPDGKGLLLPVGGNVLRWDLATGKGEPLIPAALSKDPGSAGYPQLSPDGKYLYYMHARATGVGARLMRLDLAQGQANQLITVHQFCALSPDGDELVAPVVDKNNMVLRVFGKNGEARRDLVTLGAPHQLTSAEWSPDGKQVFFSRTTGGGRIGLFRMSVDGGEPVALGFTGANYPDIRVHPNGAEIAFVDADNQMEVWRLEGLPQALARMARPPGAKAESSR